MKQMLKFYGGKFLHSDKRKKGFKSILISFLTILIAMVLALAVTSIIYHDGSLFGKIFVQFFKSPFSHPDVVNNTMGMIAIFAVAAVAFLIAMKCGLFNIGISGQMMFGGVVATIVAQHMVHIPNGLSQLLLLLVSIVTAGVIATIIGVLKAYFNVNEVVSSIMLNWIIYFIGIMMVAKLCLIGSDNLYTMDLSHLNGQNTINLVLQTPNGNSWLPLIILAIIVTIFAVVLLTYTTFGKKIINTGMSVFGAQYVGYSVKLNQVLAMSISGMIAGILGMMVYLGNATTMPIQVAAKSIPQQGFSGISVGLIAMSNPWAILPISCLFGMIDGTKAALSTNYGIDPSISDAIFGIIVYGAAVISIFYFLVPFKWYLRIFRGKVYADNYQNYINSVNQDLDDASTTIYYLKHKNLSPDSDYCFDQQFLVAKMKKFGIRCSNQKITKNKYRFYRHQIYQKYQQLRLKNKQFFLKRISVRLNKNNPNKESIVW